MTPIAFGVIGHNASQIRTSHSTIASLQINFLLQKQASLRVLKWSEIRRTGLGRPWSHFQVERNTLKIGIYRNVKYCLQLGNGDNGTIRHKSM